MKLFTPEEANGLLAVVRPLVERLVAHRREQLRAAGKLERVREKVAGNGGFEAARVLQLQAVLDKASEAVLAGAAELAELGVHVKDVDTGLVDFPARHPREGEIVFLCWRLGEDDIAFWHGVEEGFAGRKPLPF